MLGRGQVFKFSNWTKMEFYGVLEMVWWLSSQKTKLNSNYSNKRMSDFGCTATGETNPNVRIQAKFCPVNMKQNNGIGKNRQKKRPCYTSLGYIYGNDAMNSLSLIQNQNLLELLIEPIEEVYKRVSSTCKPRRILRFFRYHQVLMRVLSVPWCFLRF